MNTVHCLLTSLLRLRIYEHYLWCLLSKDYVEHFSDKVKLTTDN